ncbi:DUF4623 domain-containing protein [Sphingobacterium bambusae]|uniref:DUF4623 domain-containing protein n=1 Tax=Sphingobacterium bambusae TaxID=662858 RepID=A0ABW6BAW1_9SPHI|nr:DUF4623 domain-containing protein [Sphingobacterium bambusae]WPL46814.1 DUF4623 domain-containing protein [Sphingobacterium bambusae]
MKNNILINRYITSMWLLCGIVAVLLSGCKDDFPENVASDKFTELSTIRITNAGADGATSIEGVIDEDRKTISFPRIDPETDFENIQFEAVLSDGAKLDKERYTFPFTEGDSEKTIVIKVTNAPRYKEYFVTLRLRIPVFGADVAKRNVFDFTNNELGNPIYETFVSALTRGSGFDGEHVLVVTRHVAGSHLLKVSDLRNGVANKIPLNLSGVSQGTFAVSVGDIVNGHTYIANLSGNTAASPLKIYHWTDPNVAPQVIANINVGTIAGAGVRHGDNFTINLDDSGNGFIFFGDNAGTKVLRLTVTNYTTVGDPLVITSTVNVGSWSSFTRVGNTDNYLFTGHDAPIMVVNSAGALTHTLGRTAIPIRSSAARVVEFNGERYLLTTTAARTGSEGTVMYLYDITRGANIVDALTAFEQSERRPLLEYSFLGPANTSPSTQTGWAVIKDEEGNDETLLLYSGASDAGFVVMEIPKKEPED